MPEKSLTLIEAILPTIENKALNIVKDFTLILSLTLLTAISAKTKIEIGLVPITMQTLAVLLSGALLGSKRGVLVQITYLLSGLAGIPWFARGGGIQYILNPTFGYIIGFILAAWFVGWLCEKGLDRSLKTTILAIGIGNILIYIPGLLWLSKFVGFNKVLSVGFYPFILGDLLKISLLSLILPVSWQTVKKFKNYESI